MSERNVLIIGSGVSGLSVAHKLLLAGHRVQIWTKDAADSSPTTSASAYGMWVPVKIDADPRVERWAQETYAELVGLAARGKAGVTLRKIYQLKGEHSEPWYASSVPGVRHATSGEISADYADAHVIEAAPIVDPETYLSYLRGEIRLLGGSIVTRTVTDLSECADFDAVVNCSGLGARRLCNDSSLFPERVQVVRIKPNGFQHVVVDDEGPHKRACIVPHSDYIQLGAVFDTGSESLDVDATLTADIISRCKRMVPGFKVDPEDIISVHRALRPERPLTRVELERKDEGPHIIHNYGHDGMGYLLSCGIANEIAGYVGAL